MTQKQGLANIRNEIKTTYAAVRNKTLKFGRVILLTATVTFIHGLMSCKLTPFQSDYVSCCGFTNAEIVAASASLFLPNKFRRKTNGWLLRKTMF